MADLIGVVWGAVLQDKDIQDLDAGTETVYYYFFPHPFKCCIFVVLLFNVVTYYSDYT
jgi:hypothetical protein